MLHPDLAALLRRRKETIADHAFRDRVRLSGVNSINWARIVAQVVYYFTAAATLGAPVSTCGKVPST